MNQKRSLDKVIKKVDKQFKTNSSAEEIIIIDKSKKQIISKPSLLSGLFGGDNLVYYRVASNQSASNFAICKGLVHTVSDFATGNELDIFIDYRARCSPEKAAKVALALLSDDSPVEELDRKILAWVDEIVSYRAAQFIDNYLTESKRLEEKLQNKAKNEVGLSLEVKISAQDETALHEISLQGIINRGELKPFSPPPIDFDIKVSDYDDDLKLHLNIVLEVDEDRKRAAAENYGRESLLITLVKEEVRKYLLNYVTLHKLFYELQSSVSEEVRKRLNQSLVSKGRKVGYLSLSTESQSTIRERLALNEFWEIKDYLVQCSIKGYDKPINVKNTLQLQLKNIGKYCSAVAARQIHLDKEGKPDLDNWAKNKLDTIVKPLLLEKEYVDILLDFEPLVQDTNDTSNSISYSTTVRKQMEDAAISIGYSVWHIVSVPDLEALKFKDKCTLDTGERDYSTRDANVNVKLRVIADVKIDNLRRVNHLLNPENPLKGQMEEAIHEAASRYLNGIEPERFYMRFSSYDEGLDETQSVEQDLIKVITQELKDSFHATVTTVIPKMGNTAIISLFSDLRGQTGAFKIEVDSLGGGETVKYQGNFHVLSVEKNSWYKFQSKFQSRLEPRNLLLENIPKLHEDSSRIIRNEDSQEEFGEINDQIRFIQKEASGINDLKEAIEIYLKAKLDTLSNDELQYFSFDKRDLIEKVFNQWVNDSKNLGSILNQFGLILEIFSVSRTLTELESLRSDTRKELRKKEIASSSLHIEARDKYIGRLQQERDKLYDKRFKLIDQEDNKEELEELNKKIKFIEKEILTPSLEDADSKLKQTESEKPQTKGFHDIAQQMNLPVSEPNPVLNPSNNNDDE
ncbi:MAG: hypothetical protein QNJ55_25535 [Xenococcus sp. MO_188.B8]|nr:hypothetical protein [Xenococcus sp. MO_188.B8]